jgi:hypothetical protein
MLVVNGTMECDAESRRKMIRWEYAMLQKTGAYPDLKILKVSIPREERILSI